MIRNNILCAALLVSSALSHASDFYVVVPVKGRTASAQSISVALNTYGLPSGRVGQAYGSFDFKALLQVTGDPGFNAAQATWAVTGGALPVGLTLNSATGLLTGTPSAPGSANFQVTATYRTAQGAQSYQVNVADLTVVLSAAPLPPLTIGQAYSVSLADKLQVNGGTSFDAAQVGWSLTAGALPTGLTISAGAITGIPTGAGAETFELTAVYGGKSASQSYTLAPIAAYSVVLDGEGVAGTQVFTNQVAGPVVTVYGNVVNSAAQAKQGSGAISFDGSGDYLRADGAFGSMTTVGQSFTMEAWVYIQSAGIIFGCNHNMAPLYNQVLVSNTNLGIDGANTAVTGVPLNQWVHVAYVHEGPTNTSRLYFNGTKTHEVVRAIGHSMSGCVVGIGAEFDSTNGGAPGDYFRGYMDQIKLTPNVARYTNNFTPLP